MQRIERPPAACARRQLESRPASNGERTHALLPSVSRCAINIPCGIEDQTCDGPTAVIASSERVACPLSPALGCQLQPEDNSAAWPNHYAGSVCSVPAIEGRGVQIAVRIEGKTRLRCRTV